MKPIPGHEGYSATEDGKIWSAKTNRYLKPLLHPKGYLHVHLYAGSRKDYFSRRIHRLVALAYLPNPNNLSGINHLDGCKTNNAVANLAWVSPLENIQHAHANGLMRPPKGEGHHAAKLCDEDVREIRRLRAAGAKGRALAKVYGVSDSIICGIFKKHQWSHVK